MTWSNSLDQLVIFTDFSKRLYYFRYGVRSTSLSLRESLTTDPKPRNILEGSAKMTHRSRFWVPGSDIRRISVLGTISKKQ